MVNGIKAIGTDFLTLANNPILDQGEEGYLVKGKWYEKCIVKKLFSMQNFIECEAHCELFLFGIKGDIYIESRKSRK